MPVYRVLMNISRHDEMIRGGTVSTLSNIEQSVINILLERGAIAKASCPPLSLFANWKIRSSRLGKIGITDIGELIDADPAKLSKGLRVSRKIIERWQSEALDIIKPEVEKK